MVRANRDGGATGVGSPRIAPPLPPRDTRLDIVRGWLQLTIFASHVGGSFIGGWMIHATWGLSDSSEQFVFLSGFTLGSVFARKTMRDGAAAASRDILARARRLYFRQLWIFVVFGLLVAVADAWILPGEATATGWRWVLDHPVRAIPGVLTMLDQPEWMGILPVFVWCMALLPAFAYAEARMGDAALLFPVGLYAVTRLTGLIPPSLDPATGIGFNPFAWQLLFLTGAWLGRRALLFGRALPFHARWAKFATAGSVAVLVAGLAIRVGWYGFAPYSLPFGEGEWITGKESLALPRVLHAFALAWLVARFVPREAAWMRRAVPETMAAIGRRSLDVFCLGLFVSWAGTTVLKFLPGAITDIAVIVTGGAILAAFARWREWRGH